METELWSYVCKFRDHSENYNFTSQIVPWVGKFKIERKDIELFWKLYCDSLKLNPDMLSGLSERPNEYLPLLADIDLDIKLSDDTDIHQKLYTLEEAKIVIKVYQEVLKDVVRDWKASNCICFLLEKKAPYVSGEKLKGGFHLHFPLLWVRNCDHDLHIVPRVIKKLNEDYKNLFKRLNEQNTGDLVDKKVANKHWLIYGGCKNENSGSYRFSYAFDCNSNEISLKTALDKYKILDINEDEIKISNDYEYYLPRILSIHPANKKITVMKTNLECYSKSSIRSVKERNNNNITSNIDESIQIASELMRFISPSRADARDDWMEMGWILYNIGNGCNEALDLWISFSSMTTKNNFDESFCVHQWNKMVNTNKYSIGTLRHYASIDSPYEYETWKKNKVSNRIKDSLLGGHNDLAKMLHDCYANNFVCSGLIENSWFEFKEHKWKITEKGTSLRKKISNELVTKFTEETKKYLYETKVREDDEDGFQKKMKLMNGIVKNLKTAPFKNNIMVEAAEVFYNEDFADRLNSDIYLLGFTNGVFDIRTMTFREGRPEDYISKSTKYDYKNFTDDDPQILDTREFLIKVFPDPLLRRYFLEYAAMLLKGGNSRKTFLVMSGGGDNGKSVTIELIEKTLGEYSIKLPTSLLTGARTQSSQACPELARIHGIRFAVLQEPDTKDVINIGILKELTGNDSIYNRTLYKGGREISPMFKLALICNNLPRLPGQDPASWNRIRVLIFESRFPKETSEVPKTPEEQLKKKIFNRDETFAEKLPAMRQAFMWILIQVLKEMDIKGGPSEEPFKVTEATSIYRKNNDVFLRFVTECVIEASDETSYISLNEANNAFRQWFRESCPNLKSPPDKVDLQEDLNKRWGPPSSNFKWYGVRLRNLRDDVIESKALILTQDDLDNGEDEKTECEGLDTNYICV